MLLSALSWFINLITGNLQLEWYTWSSHFSELKEGRTASAASICLFLRLPHSELDSLWDWRTVKEADYNIETQLMLLSHYSFSGKSLEKFTQQICCSRFSQDRASSHVGWTKEKRSVWTDGKNDQALRSRHVMEDGVSRLTTSSSTGMTWSKQDPTGSKYWILTFLYFSFSDFTDLSDL